MGDCRRSEPPYGISTIRKSSSIYVLQNSASPSMCWTIVAIAYSQIRSNCSYSAADYLHQHCSLPRIFFLHDCVAALYPIIAFTIINIPFTFRAVMKTHILFTTKCAAGAFVFYLALELAMAAYFSLSTALMHVWP